MISVRLFATVRYFARRDVTFDVIRKDAPFLVQPIVNANSCANPRDHNGHVAHFVCAELIKSRGVAYRQHGNRLSARCGSGVFKSSLRRECHRKWTCYEERFCFIG